MNYVILNDRKSTEIDGLLIQSLPSISKPMIRTEVEEIDGRDGDIVTELGYSAYNRSMEIGLYGDYNIDDVIEFFDSKGTAVFSNEPDKIYRYSITDQIDFERLLRFRTATVTFHVQPFKYSAVNNIMSIRNDFFNISSFFEKKNGITCIVRNGLMSVSGMATEETEISVPLSVTVDQGVYTIKASTDGVVGNAVKMIVDDLELELKQNEVTEQKGVFEDESIGHMKLVFKPYVTVGFTLNVEMVKEKFTSCQIRNTGNVFAKPKLTLYGSGGVVLFINNQAVLEIDIDNLITIDAEEMNAYRGTELANRSVKGNYNDVTLKRGLNTISWLGNVQGIDIENFSRWR